MSADREHPSAEAATTLDQIVAGIADGSIELPPEVMGEAVDAPDASEPPVEEEWYRCKYGHLQRGEYFVRSRDPLTGQVDWQSGPMCARCVVQWQAQKFRNRRVAAPKAPPKGA